jgi:predicted amidophosphoribosyltransferase
VLSSTTQFWILSGFLLAVVAILLLLVRTRGGGRPIKCAACGNENPPYARSYCVKCGAPLSDRRRSA